MRGIIERFFSETNVDAHPVFVDEEKGWFDYVRYYGGFDTPSWGTGHVENGNVVIDC